MSSIASPLVALFLSVSLGYLLGKIKFGFFELGGVCGTLFVALAIGQLNVEIGDDLKNMAFALFIFTLGYTAGPQFFANIRGGWRFGIFSVIEVVTAIGLTLVFVALFQFDVGTAAGIFAGSATESAVVGTASEAITHMDLAGGKVSELQSNIATAYSLTYLFGMVGIIIFASQIAPRLLGIDLREEAEKIAQELGADEQEFDDSGFPIFVERAFKVGGQAGQHVQEIEDRFHWTLTVSAIQRDDKTFSPEMTETFREGDIIFLRGRRTAVVEASDSFGDEVAFHEPIGFEVATQEVVLLNKKALTPSLHDLGSIVAPELRRSVFVKSIRRMDQTVPAYPRTKLQIGDILTLYGPAERLDEAAEILGKKMPEAHVTDYFFLGLGLVVGLLIGQLAITIKGIELTLGQGGGALIAGLVFGWINMRQPRLGSMPRAAASFAKEFGLAVFIAAIGLKAGPDALKQLKEYGLILPLIGLVVSVGPAFVSLIIGAKLMKIPAPILLGAIAGQHCSTPTLVAVIERTGNSTPVIGYTVTYAISNVLLPLMGSVIVALAALVVAAPI